MVRNLSNITRSLVAGILISLIGSFALFVFTAPEEPIRAQAGDITLILGAYSTPREVYKEIIPLFQKYWLDKTGKTVVLQESYDASGAQSRAIAGGFEADVAALSLEADINRLVDAKLITHDWKANDYRGIVSTSVVVFAVRNGNPKNILDWADLAQPNLEILTPDPATSGGAQWNLLAALGAAKRGKVKGYEASDGGALKFLGAVLKNVSVLDKDGRTSILNYEKGVGDMAITYENEVTEGQQAGATYQAVYPVSTILIETPIAVVDAYVDKHGTREVAEAFVNFLWTPEAQAIFAKHGYRPPQSTLASTSNSAVSVDPVQADQFPAIQDLFTIDQFGGWAKATPDYFGKDGKVTQLLATIRSQ